MFDMSCLEYRTTVVLLKYLMYSCTSGTVMCFKGGESVVNLVSPRILPLTAFAVVTSE